jgi:hypothetical protein
VREDLETRLTVSYFNASLISISRFSTSVTSSDRSTPRREECGEVRESLC